MRTRCEDIGRLADADGARWPGDGLLEQAIASYESPDAYRDLARATRSCA